MTLYKKKCYGINNPQISGMWRDSSIKTKEALQSHYVKSLENLSEYTKSLPPLNYGDHVLQNQTGSFLNKWGKVVR